MGVHTTFVRSVDLDEWTQRQIDAMRLGGNGNARQFFRKHGFTDFHGKIEKKYKSKAAQAYRTELNKLVEGVAAQRGEEAVPPNDSSSAVDAAATTTTDADDADGGLLLQNLSLAEQKEQQAIAQQKLAAARSSEPIQPTAKLASQLPGAKGRLATPPSSGSGPKLILRKLSNTSSTSSSLAAKNLLKKKPSNTGSKLLRINKLGSNVSNNSSHNSASAVDDSSDVAFEDIEATQKASAEAQKQAEQVAQDEAMAKQLQKAELANGGGEAGGSGGNSSRMTTTTSVTSGAPPSSSNNNDKPQETAAMLLSPIKSPTSPSLEKAASMEDNMAKLKAMNSGFFGGL